MIPENDLETLRRWVDCDMSPATAGRLAAHPGFTEAARRLNRAKVAAAADPDMALISRDAGHYVAAALAFSLHAGEGITMPRLQAACTETGLMSLGRARAMLGYLRHIGFLTQTSPRQGKAAACYVPTPRFIRAWCGRMRRGLEAALPLEPAVKGLLDGMNNPEIAMAFARIRGQGLVAGLARAVGHDLPFVRIFNHRLGGGRALALLLSRDTGTGPFATVPVPWALDDIMVHCGISRVQARRLFDDALAENLIRIENGQLTWQDAARQFIIYSSAFEFVSMLVSAATTVTAFRDAFSESERAWSG